MEALTECLEALLITSHDNRTVEYARFDLSHVSKTKAIHVRDPVLVNLNISPFSFALKRLLRLLAVNLTGIKVYLAKKDFEFSSFKIYLDLVTRYVSV